MKHARMHTGSPLGVGGTVVTVDVGIETVGPSGPRRFDLPGLADYHAKETRLRVLSSLDQVGHDVYAQNVVASFSPEDLPKSPGQDLALALGVLVANGDVPPDPFDSTCVLGELSLTSALRPVRGVLPMLLAAKAKGFRRAIVPEANAGEASVVAGMDVRSAVSLFDVMAWAKGAGDLPPAAPRDTSADVSHAVDLSDVRGNPAAKRALEIAAAGGHNLLFVASPGAGAHLLARILPDLLPRMTEAEAIEATSVFSVAGLHRPGQGLIGGRPFRAPHHTASLVGMMGGGDPPRPGEISLANHGVMLLDELTEFPREHQEAIRNAWLDGEVTVTRGRTRVRFPSHCQLVAATMPCPCGYFGEEPPRCACNPKARARYRSRIERILPWFDLQVHVHPAERGDAPGPDTNYDVRERVTLAREMQRRRDQGCENARLTGGQLRGVIFDRAASDVLGTTPIRSHVDAVKRVARTIADLAGSTSVQLAHVREALSLAPEVA